MKHDQDLKLAVRGWGRGQICELFIVRIWQDTTYLVTMPKILGVAVVEYAYIHTCMYYTYINWDNNNFRRSFSPSKPIQQLSTVAVTGGEPRFETTQKWGCIRETLFRRFPDRFHAAVFQSWAGSSRRQGQRWNQRRACTCNAERTTVDVCRRMLWSSSRRPCNTRWLTFLPVRPSSSAR